jgi:cell division protein FtsB
MRSLTLVLAFAATCAASPVLAQAHVLTVQDQAQPPGQTSPAAQAQDQALSPPAPPPQAQVPLAPQAQVPPPPAPPQAQAQPAPPPAQAQVPPPSAQPKITERAPSEPRPLPLPSLPPAFPSRYSFNRVDNGFLRLDHATGQIAYCSAHTVGWACQAVPEDRAALESEIARLQDEVAALKKEVAALREPPPPRPPAPIPPPAAAPDKNGALKLPSQEDIDRARAYIVETWRRLVDMINQIQQDMMRKRDSDNANGLSRT